MDCVNINVSLHYVCAVALTLLFVMAVDLLMSTRLERIHMAEALKSNE